MHTISVRLLVLLLVIILQLHLLMIPQTCYSAATNTASMVVAGAHSAPDYDTDVFGSELGRHRRKKKPWSRGGERWAHLDPPPSPQLNRPRHYKWFPRAPPTPAPSPPPPY